MLFQSARAAAFTPLTGINNFRGVVPTALRGGEYVGLQWPPATTSVGAHRVRVFEYRLDHCPGRFHGVLAHK